MLQYPLMEDGKMVAMIETPDCGLSREAWQTLTKILAAIEPEREQLALDFKNDTISNTIIFKPYNYLIPIDASRKLNMYFDTQEGRQ